MVGLHIEAAVHSLDRLVEENTLGLVGIAGPGRSPVAEVDKLPVVLHNLAAGDTVVAPVAGRNSLYSFERDRMVQLYWEKELWPRQKLVVMRDLVEELRCKVVGRMLEVEGREVGASLPLAVLDKEHNLVAAEPEQVVLLRILEVDLRAAFSLLQDRLLL